MAWQPLERKDIDPSFIPNPVLQKLKANMGLEDSDEIWLNDLYQVTVDYMKSDNPAEQEGRDGMLHLSIHLLNRNPVRNWRHLQAIKNEVAGEDRVAVEIFPPEEHLVDTSNEYHLWVLPKGVDIPFAWHERLVSSDRQAEDFTNDPAHQGRQEPWEPGISTGGDRSKDDPQLPKKMVPPSPAPAKRVKGIVG